MQRLLISAAIWLLFVLPLTGQTTTVTGTVKDLTNSVVTSGQVTFELKPGLDTTISGSARFTPSTVTCTINGSGLIKANDGTSACVVTQNTALTPSGTYFKVCIQAYSVTPGSCFNWYALATTFDITTAVPTPGTLPAYTFADIASAQTITGNKTFSGTTVIGNLNGEYDASQFANIQAAVTAAGSTGSVKIPANYSGVDTFTNPNKIPIRDLRGGASRWRSKFTLQDFGGRCDCIQVTDAAISATFTTLSSNTAAFTPGDVGKTVSILGAGPAAATLGTTITAYLNSTSVTVANAASSTVVAAIMVFGTDNAVPFQAAASALTATTGSVLNIGTGTACTSAAITFPNTSWILEGNGGTVSQIQAFPHLTNNLLDLTNDNGPQKTIRDLQLGGPATGVLGATGVVLNGSNGVLFQNVWLRGLAKGVDATTSTLLQFSHVTSEFNTIGLNFNSAATEVQVDNFTSFKDLTALSLAAAANTTFSATNINCIAVQTICVRDRGTGAQFSNISGVDSNPASGYTPKILDFDGAVGSVVHGLNVKGWAVANGAIFENTATDNYLDGFTLDGTATGLSLQSSSNNNSITDGKVLNSTVADVAMSGVTSVNLYNVNATLTAWAGITNYLNAVGSSDTLGSGTVTQQTTSGTTKYSQRIDNTNGNWHIDGYNGAWTGDIYKITRSNLQSTFGTQVNFSAAALSSAVTGGIGYQTGAGCAQTQATNKSTGVVCTGLTGAITMNNANLAATTSVGFTVTDTSVAATDTIIVNIKSGATVDSYTVTVDTVAAGSFRISLRNYTAGGLAESVVINFAVIKGVTS